jgi:hypothetical protein
VTHSLAILGLVAACATGRQRTDTPPRQVFTVPVPAQASTAQVVAVLRDVLVPRTAPVRLRLYAVINGADSIQLGSTAIPAISRQAQASDTLHELRVAVTDGMRSWLKTAGRSDSIRVSIRAFGDAGRELTAWRVGSLTIVADR